jgi:hypothetical protein
LNNQLGYLGICIHTACLVERPCVQDRREFERYESFIPWSVLQGHEQQNDIDGEPLVIEHNSPINSRGWSKPSNHCRKPLSETAACPYIDPEMAKRLRTGARLLKDCGRTDLGHFAEKNNPNEMKVRVRTSTMDEPYHHLCRISISMRQPRQGIVEKIIGLLLAYARLALSDEELVSLALQVSIQDSQTYPTLHDCMSVCLLEPALTKFEGKIRTKLCGNSNNNATKMPKAVERSIERMEIAILAHQ